MKTRWYAVVAVFAFIVGLLIAAPAATIYGWLSAKRPPTSIAFYGLEGNLAEGRVAGIFVDGHAVLNDLHWTFEPIRLLLAQVAFHIDGGGKQASLQGQVALSPFSKVTLNKFVISAGVKALLTAVGQPFLPVDGQATMTFNSLKLRGLLPRAADGEIKIQHLAWTLAANPVALGDFTATVTTDRDVVSAKIDALPGGPVEANGEATLGSDQKYVFNLQLRARANADPMVRNLINSVGPPDSQGWSHLRQQGQLQ